MSRACTTRSTPASRRTLQDGRTPRETLDAIRAKVAEHMDRQARVLQGELRPALAEHGIRIVRLDDVSADERERLDERFRRQIFPVLTPLAVGLGRPFPYISNLSLSLGVVVHDPVSHTQVFARVKVPTEMLPRFVPLADGRTFVPLEELIAKHLDQLFPGMEIVDTAVFRVTRDADFTVSDEADDLLQAVEDELRRRRFGEVVRVEVESGMSREMREQLERALEAEHEDVFAIDGLLDLNDLWEIVKIPGFPELRDPPWTPLTQPRAAAAASPRRSDVMAAMREGDILLHHPYDSFSTLGRAAGRGGGRRPRRARDQADRVPHERRLAARPGADPRRRARQAGGLPGGAQGALRRARQHHAGRGRWRRRACTSSTACRRSRPTPSAS